MLITVQKLYKNEAYVTIKDDKEGSIKDHTNPSKADMGKISKQILDRVNNNISEKNKVNQWKNTSSAIEWHCNIKRKYQCSFVIFDIESF